MLNCECMCASREKGWAVGVALAVGVIALPAPAAAHAQSPPAAASLSGIPVGVAAFVDVTVIPMDSERVLPRHTVVVENGRITALGPKDRVTVPAGATRIDGQGKYLLPGLADMHTHVYGDRRKLAEGVTTVRDMTTTAVVPVPNRTVVSEILAPYLYTSSKWMYKDARPGKPVPSPDAVASAVNAYQAAGYDHIKPYSESPEVFELLVAAARRVGLPVAGHVPQGVPLAMALANMKSIEHLEGYLEYDLEGGFRQPRLPERAKFAEIATAHAAATRQAGVWNCPTLVVLRLNAQQRGRSKDFMVFARQLVKAMQDAGAGLLLGSDVFFVVADELDELVLAGLTPYQALVAGTRNPAAYFGILDSTGTIAVGKRADLMLLAGNPLQDIRHAREPAGVMLRSHWLDRDALDRLVMAPPKRPGKSPLPDKPLNWFFYHALDVVNPGLSEAQTTAQEASRAQLRALADSVMPVAVGQPGSREHQRLGQRMAEQFGALRTRLTPEQHAGFDAMARVWLREQRRQGLRLVIPGVTSVP